LVDQGKLKHIAVKVIDKAQDEETAGIYSRIMETDASALWTWRLLENRTIELSIIAFADRENNNVSGKGMISHSSTNGMEISAYSIFSIVESVSQSMWGCCTRGGISFFNLDKQWFLFAFSPHA